jgi:hypothetical protein
MIYQQSRLEPENDEHGSESVTDCVTTTYQFAQGTVNDKGGKKFDEETNAEDAAKQHSIRTSAIASAFTLVARVASLYCRVIMRRRMFGTRLDAK